MMMPYQIEKMLFDIYKAFLDTQHENSNTLRSGIYFHSPCVLKHYTKHMDIHIKKKAFFIKFLTKLGLVDCLGLKIYSYNAYSCSLQLYVKKEYTGREDEIYTIWRMMRS